MLTSRENTLRAVRFERPDFIPVCVVLSPACWYHYPQEALQELLASHPFLFPDFTPQPTPFEPDLQPWQRAGQRYVDSWGCQWETPLDGITGAVVVHPLATWDAFEGYRAPDPAVDSGWAPLNWAEVEADLVEARAKGELPKASLRHGHTFMTLMYIRGYENVILDMADEEPRLWQLLEMIESLNQALVARYLALGVEWMGYPEDLGMQVGPMIPPKLFVKYLKPAYQRMVEPVREAGCVIHMHSDGDIRLLAEELLGCGVEVLNLQDLVNGLDWIDERLKGKVCIDLDVDRQAVMRFGSPRDIDELIRGEVARLGSREGGLMLTHGIYPGIPLENMRAALDALERYARYFS